MRHRGRIGAAVEAYRRGKDRTWPMDRMIPAPPTSPDEPEWSPAPAAARFGVGVAARLEFLRGPADWRPADPGSAGVSPHPTSDARLDGSDPEPSHG